MKRRLSVALFALLLPLLSNSAQASKPVEPRAYVQSGRRLRRGHPVQYSRTL